METGFDFEQFYVNEQVKTEAVIDRSGVNLQNPTEQTEYVTNNVVYFVNDIIGIMPDGSEYVLNRDTQRLGVVEAGSVAPDVYFIRSMHPLGEVAGIDISSEWDPKTERESMFVGEPSETYFYIILDDTNPSFILYPVSFRASVFPRHESEINADRDPKTQSYYGPYPVPTDQGVISDAGVMKLLYGALGIYGGRWKGLKWLNKVWDKGNRGDKYAKDRAVLSYDRFKRNLDRLAEICQEADVGFSVTYYDQSFATEVDAEDATREDYRKNPAAARKKHEEYRRLVEQSDVTKTKMNNNTTFAEAYGKHLDEFREKGFLTETGPATALVPPVNKAVASFFYPVDELEDDFSSLFKGVMDSISKVPFVWRFVSTSTKNNIDRVSQLLAQYPTGDGYMAFDMDIVFVSIMGLNPLIPKALRALPRLIQVNGPYVCGTNPLSGEGREKWKVNCCWDANDFDTVFLSYAMANSPCDKNTIELDSDGLIELMVDYWNHAVDAGKIEEAYRQELDTVKQMISQWQTVSELPVDDPARVAYEGWWITGNDDFGIWFLNLCGFMNYMRDNANDGTGITVSAVNNLATNVINDFFYVGNVTNSTHILDSWMPNGSYKVIAWENGADTGITSYREAKLFTPAYAKEWNAVTDMPYISAGILFDAVDYMRDAYQQMVRAASVQALVLGPTSAALAAMKLDDISDDLDELTDVCRKMTWYQRVTGMSPFSNKSLINGSWNPIWLASFPAHLAFPVSMYKRVRVRYRNMFGRIRHKWVKRSIGVRWAEVTFYDASVFGEYSQVDEEPMETFAFPYAYEISTEGDTAYITFDESLPDAAVETGRCAIVATGMGNGQVNVPATVLNDVMVSVSVDSMPAQLGNIVSIKTPLKPSQPDGSKEPITIQFKMPGLPYDSEIRKKSFIEYGSLSQAKTFEAVRNTGIDTDRKEGWRIFHSSSSSIADLREGIGLHDKVAMLVSILKHEFGPTRVSLAETYRSMEDQQKMCSGGPESEFLSWHNYGLAAKILILKNDGKTPMEKDDPDMKRLIQVARAFTECCATGAFGRPCNVVWCARLAIGASLFDWEFLPIGVNHKDAPQFRDMIISQKDPVHELGYVDVDGKNYVMRTPPTGQVPYILSDSAVLEHAEMHAGHRYVSPDNIRNFPHVDDIVLYDVKEYVNLIKLKMSANGTSRPTSGSLYDWKSMNPDSSAQLIRYYAMIGSVAAAKSLIAGEFVERYLPVEEQFFNTSPVDYVKGMLGSHYEDIRICTKQDGDSTFITLHDGILHIKQLDAYPDNLPTRFDMHKQQRVDKEHVKWGSWHDGVFYTEDERPVPYVESEAPVIDGYVDGEAVDGEALLLHQVVATKIHKAFQEIKKRFENFGGALMYDRVEDGPNAGMGDMLENEFGLIKAQDLLSFDDLEAIVDNLLNTVNNGGRIMVDGSIYEKVVNNAQLAGVRKASLTKEHIHVKDMPTPSDGKTLYELIQKGKGYMANDLI